jgi:transposase
MTDIVKIRNEHISNGKNPHQIATKMGISWATANSYINKTEEEIKYPQKRPNRKSTFRNSEVISAIQDYLRKEIELKIHKKQKVTAVALFNILKSRNIYHGKERTFRRIFSKEKKIFKVSTKSYLELDFPLGEYLQFDHGPLEVSYCGEVYNAYLFCASVPQYSLRYCQVYLKKSFESWGDFHEKTFKFFGGVFPNCIYDNDSVLKITSNMKKTNFTLELENHYGFESIFCNKAAGWEKGSVENAVGTCRRNYLNGRPLVEDLQSFNDGLEAQCLTSINESQHYKTKEKLSHYFDIIRDNKLNTLTPLPADYNWGSWFELGVDSRQYIRYQNVFYSVPEKFIGAKMKVHISSYKVDIYCDGELVANHIRSFTQGKDSFLIDHFLGQLERKPKAIKFSKVMKETVFSDILKELQEKLRNRMDEQRANLEFIKVLKLQKTCSESDFNTAIEFGFSYGGITSDAIASFIMQLQRSQLIGPNEKISLPKNCKDQPDIRKEFNLKNYLELCISPSQSTSKQGYLQ